MKLNKIIQTTFPISPLNLYSQTDELTLLKETYEGVCYNGCLILEILEVKQKSLIRILMDDRTCPGSIDVTFSAIVEEYSAGDIIVATIVKPLGSGSSLLCTSDHCAITVNVGKIASAFKPGDLIPVQIKGVEYLIGKNIANCKPISINAQMPVFRPAPFFVAQITSEPTKIVEEYINIFKQYEAKLNDADKKKIAEFKACIYPYKTIKTPQIKSKSELGVDDLMKIKVDQLLCFPPEFPRNTPRVLELKDGEGLQVVKVSGDIYLSELLMQCIRYMVIMLDLVHHFDKPSSDKTMRVYWAFINNTKSD